MSKRSAVGCSLLLLGSENARTADTDVSNACLSRCFQMRICLKAYVGVSCRNGRFATAMPWLEISIVGIQSSPTAGCWLDVHIQPVTHPSGAYVVPTHTVPGSSRWCLKTIRVL